MASRSRCQAWILGEHDRPAGTGPLPVRFVTALLGVMICLPTVGRHQTPGDQTSDEASELLTLAEGELIPEGRDHRWRARPIQRRGGTDPDVCLRMGKLLVVGRA